MKYTIYYYNNLISEGLQIDLVPHVFCLVSDYGTISLPAVVPVLVPGFVYDVSLKMKYRY
jgi:hypothetical protein